MSNIDLLLLPRDNENNVLDSSTFNISTKPTLTTTEGLLHNGASISFFRNIDATSAIGDWAWTINQLAAKEALGLFNTYVWSMKINMRN